MVFDDVQKVSSWNYTFSFHLKHRPEISQKAADRAFKAALRTVISLKLGLND